MRMPLHLARPSPAMRAKPMQKRPKPLQIHRCAKMAYQDMPKRHIKNCRNRLSGTARSAHQELPEKQIKICRNRTQERLRVKRLRVVILRTVNLSICKQIPVRGLCLRLRRTNRPRMKRSSRKFLTNASWSYSRTVCGECWCRRSNGCIIPTVSGSAAQDCRRKRCAVT